MSYAVMEGLFGAVMPRLRCFRFMIPMTVLVVTCARSGGRKRVYMATGTSPLAINTNLAVK